MFPKYRVHRFEIRMTADQSKLEQFLNSLEGEIIAIIPAVGIVNYIRHPVSSPLDNA